jgi:LmeA-like phospholipid-binding
VRSTGLSLRGRLDFVRPSCVRGLGCLVVALLLLGGAGLWGWRRLTWHPPSPPPPAPARIREARRQTADLERKIARLVPPPRPRRPLKATRTPPTHPIAAAFKLTLTEDELNAALQPDSDAAHTLEAFGLRAPSVGLKPGRVTLSTYFREGDAEFYVTSDGAPYLNRQHKIRFRIHDVHVGQVPAPAPLRRSLQFQLDLALRQLDKQVAAHLDKVTVTRGKLIIQGHGAAGEDRVSK